MRIKLLTLMAGPEGVFQVGSVIDLPDKQALALVTSSQADVVVGLVEKIEEGPPAAVRETAVSKSAKKREKLN